MRTPLNLTLLSGFLGAGKTTLVNHLLREGYPGERLAVLVNDFGKLAVDASLIQSAGDDLLELRNGCICCSLQHHLESGLRQLAERGCFHRVIMETSGITNTRLLLEFLRPLNGGQDLRVDQTIAVADATRFLRQSSRMPLVCEQLTGARLILLNRCDQATPELRRDTRQALAPLAPHALIVETEHCRFDTRLLQQLPPAPAIGEPIVTPHEQDWHAARIVFSGAVDPSAVKTALDTLPATVQRIKGFISDGAGVWCVERVGRDVTLTRQTTGISNELIGQLGAIAEEPIGSLLQQAFACFPNATVEVDTPTTRHEANSGAQ